MWQVSLPEPTHLQEAAYLSHEEIHICALDQGGLKLPACAQRNGQVTSCAADKAILAQCLVWLSS